MVYDPAPPYALLQSALHSFEDVQRMQRLARYWDLVGNSGRFSTSLRLLLDVDPVAQAVARAAGLASPKASAFWRFMAFSDWLWRDSGKTHQFSYEQLIESMYLFLTEDLLIGQHHARMALASDYLASGARGNPALFKDGAALAGQVAAARKRPKQALQARLERHAGMKAI